MKKDKREKKQPRATEIQILEPEDVLKICLGLRTVAKKVGDLRNYFLVENDLVKANALTRLQDKYESLANGMDRAKKVMMQVEILPVVLQSSGLTTLFEARAKQSPEGAE